MTLEHQPIQITENIREKAQQVAAACHHLQEKVDAGVGKITYGKHLNDLKSAVRLGNKDLLLKAGHANKLELHEAVDAHLNELIAQEGAKLGIGSAHTHEIFSQDKKAVLGA